MGLKEDDLLFQSISEHNVKCKCSHVITIARADRTICSYCGNWVYRTPEIEFKYKTMEKLKKIESGKNE